MVFENHRKSLIASEASYVYILSGQKMIKNAKNGPFRRVFETWSLRSNSVTRQVSFNRTKIGGKCQNSNATFWVIFKQCVQGVLDMLAHPVALPLDRSVVRQYV